jgi:hypothetical protein
MLTRGHRSHPVDAQQPLMRCELGWALHNEVEVQRCRATEAVMDCWKVHPERIPLVVMTAEETATEPATFGLAPAEHKASAD